MQSRLEAFSPPATPQNGRPASRTLLVGTGHAHLFALKRADDYRRRGAAVTAVSPDGFWYSGLATGMLGGQYGAELDRVDVAALGGAHGARIIRGEALHIDAAARTVSLDGGETLPYDVLSLNVGSVVAPLPGGVGHPAVFPVKPIRQLWALREFLSARFDAAREAARAGAVVRGAENGESPGSPVRVVVAGGGATGCEIAANVAALAERRGAGAAITVVTSNSRLLEQLPASAATEVESFFGRRGIAVLCDRLVMHVDGRSVRLSDGNALEFDALVNATGLKPPRLIAASGLAVDREGALLVDAHLRSVAEPTVFGGGDCIAIDGHPLPRIGVYAVRQAPVLHANVLAASIGGRTRPFRPQRQFLSIMNLGDGTALAWRSRLWWRGRAAQVLKDWIDRRFVDGYRA